MNTAPLFPKVPDPLDFEKFKIRNGHTLPLSSESENDYILSMETLFSDWMTHAAQFLRVVIIDHLFSDYDNPREEVLFRILEVILAQQDYIQSVVADPKKNAESFDWIHFSEVKLQGVSFDFNWELTEHACINLRRAETAYILAAVKHLVPQFIPYLWEKNQTYKIGWSYLDLGHTLSGYIQNFNRELQFDGYAADQEWFNYSNARKLQNAAIQEYWRNLFKRKNLTVRGKKNTSAVNIHDLRGRFAVLDEAYPVYIPDSVYDPMLEKVEGVLTKKFGYEGGRDLSTQIIANRQGNTYFREYLKKNKDLYRGEYGEERFEFLKCLFVELTKANL